MTVAQKPPAQSDFLALLLLLLVRLIISIANHLPFVQRPFKPDIPRINHILPTAMCSQYLTLGLTPAKAAIAITACVFFLVDDDPVSYVSPSARNYRNWGQHVSRQYNCSLACFQPI